MRIYSLFLTAGNLSLSPRKRTENSALIPAAASSLAEFPCIFPADQGKDSRDEFAPDSPHRHPVCASRDCPQLSKFSPRSSRDSAGFWRLGSFEFEPETVSFGVDKRVCARLSLLPIRAVRFGARVGAKSRHASSRPGFANFRKTKVEVRIPSAPPLSLRLPRLLPSIWRWSEKFTRSCVLRHSGARPLQ